MSLDKPTDEAAAEAAEAGQSPEAMAHAQQAAQQAAKDAEKQQVAKWQTQVKLGEGCKFRKERLRRSETNRLALQGWISTNDAPNSNEHGERVLHANLTRVSRNFIKAQYNTLLPTVVARDPQFEVQPEVWLGVDALPEDIRGALAYSAEDAMEPPPWVPALAKVAEALLNTCLQQSELRQQAARAIAQAMIAGCAWLKLQYTGTLGDDRAPLLQVLMLKLSEMVVPKGTQDLRQVEQLPWLAMRRRLTVAVFKERFGRCPCNSTQDEDMVLVYEIWCRRDKAVYWWAEGESEWCCPPERPSDTGSGFYPFFLVPWCVVESEADQDIDPYPHGAIDDWLEEQMRIHIKAVKEQELVNAHRSAMLVNSAAVNQKDVRKLDLGKNGELIVVDMSDAGSNPFLPYPNPPYDAAIFSNAENIRTLDQLSGVADFARGGVTRTKTLGEAQLMADSATSRQLYQADQLEQALGKLGRYALELLVHHLDRQTVAAIVGSAGRIWPESLPPTQVLQMLKVQVVAGSAGKPDRMAELNRLVSVMPLIEKQMLLAQQAKQAGDFEMAKAARNVAGEVLYRADERLSLESIWPVSSVAAPVAPPLPPAPPTAPQAPVPNVPPVAMPPNPSMAAPELPMPAALPVEGEAAFLTPETEMSA